MTLSEFLLARIGEDEEVARAATPGPWVLYGDGNPNHYGWEVGVTPAFEPWPHRSPGVDHRGDVVGRGYDGGGTQQADGSHIARWDPARVLAEAEAKRRIVELCSADGMPNPDSEYARGWLTLGYFVQQSLALLWRDHPDFQPEWLTLLRADHPDYQQEWKP